MTTKLKIGDPAPDFKAIASPSRKEPHMKHVVTVGGGFAGLTCARTLASHSDIRITLIDKSNFQQFQPLLYKREVLLVDVNLGREKKLVKITCK